MVVIVFFIVLVLVILILVNVILVKGKLELNWKMMGLVIFFVVVLNMVSFWSLCLRRVLLEVVFKLFVLLVMIVILEIWKCLMVRFVLVFLLCKLDGVGVGEFGKWSVIDGIVFEVRFECLVIVLVCVVG